MKQDNACKTEIPGVLIRPLLIIETSGGPVLRMIRKEQDFCPALGEVYFSQINPGFIKAWKRHKMQIQNFAVPWGLIKIVLFDDRPESPSCGKQISIVLGRPDHYSLLTIPPMIWYGFQSLNCQPALICNMANMPHDPGESESVSITDKKAPCKWPEN